MKRPFFRPRNRRRLYIGFGVGSCVVSYCAVKGYIGLDEVALWTNVGTFFGLGAAAKVDIPKARHRRRRRADH